MVELPARVTRHRLVSFATDQVVAPEQPTRKVERRLGLASTPIVLDAPAADAAASFHAEVELPRGGAFAAAAVVASGRESESRTLLLGRRAALYPSVASGVETELALAVCQERGYFFFPAAGYPFFGRIARQRPRRTGG
jgi:hypothetical protein